MPVSRILHLPADLVGSMRVYRTHHTVTNTQLAVRALNAHWQQLSELVAAESTGGGTGGGGLLLEELTPVRPSTPRRQVEVTLTGHQLSVIDPLVAKTAGVRDRSHLFTLVLQAFLAPA